MRDNTRCVKCNGSRSLGYDLTDKDGVGPLCTRCYIEHIEAERDRLQEEAQILAETTYGMSVKIKQLRKALEKIKKEVRSTRITSNAGTCMVNRIEEFIRTALAGGCRHKNTSCRDDKEVCDDCGRVLHDPSLGPGIERDRETPRITCLWTWDMWHEYFDTSCDHPYCTEPDELEKGIFKFCPYCGRDIELQMPDDREKRSEEESCSHESYSSWSTNTD